MEDFKWTTFLIAWILALSRTTKKKKKNCGHRAK